MEPQLDLLINLLLNHAVNGISLLKESALSALSSVVEVAKAKYEPYLTKSLSTLFGFFAAEQYSGK